MTKEQLETRQQIFKELNAIDLGERIKKKLGLSYLSWANAWEILRTKYPDAEYKIYTREVETTETREITDVNTGVRNVVTNTFKTEYPYFTDGKTCWVKVGVTICGIEEVEILAVMDNHQNSVPFATITSVAVNKAIQRAFVKACARHGLGLYIYSGEDLPEADRKVIDFKAIGDNCDRFKTVTLNQEGFDKMKQDVITGVQDKYPDDAAKALTDYVVKVANGKRLSMFDLEHDSQNLQRIYNFINELKKQLAAPNGR